jgi:2-keto-4-pentenoate hydratase/2-oxohepta-3-ene-1,7-dioic acid hydratase in catechol pathway
VEVIRFKDRVGTVCYGTPQTNGTARKIQGNIFSEFVSTDEEVEISKILAPLVPSQILCIGLNYRFHATECGLKVPEFPVLFTKGTNAVQHPNDPIEIPRALPTTEVDYEAELAVVIGQECRNVKRTNAMDHVLGYTCANDVSARDWQLKKGGGQWCRGKTFDTFLPLGPSLVLKDDIPDPHRLGIRCTVNGLEVQNWKTDDMIFEIPDLIEFLSASTTLAPGTVILTGTPHGVGMSRKPPLWLKAGDTVAIEIDAIGSLRNPVIDEVIVE